MLKNVKYFTFSFNTHKYTRNKLNKQIFILYIKYK